MDGILECYIFTTRSLKLLGTMLDPGPLPGISTKSPTVFNLKERSYAPAASSGSGERGPDRLDMLQSLVLASTKVRIAPLFLDCALEQW